MATGLHVSVTSTSSMIASGCDEALAHIIFAVNELVSQLPETSSPDHVTEMPLYSPASSVSASKLVGSGSELVSG